MSLLQGHLLLSFHSGAATVNIRLLFTSGTAIASTRADFFGWQEHWKQNTGQIYGIAPRLGSQPGVNDACVDSIRFYGQELGEHRQKHAGQPRSIPRIPHKGDFDCAGHDKTQMRYNIVTSSKIWQHEEELGEHRHQDARILHFRALGWLQDRLHGHRIIKRRSWSISSHSWTDSLQNGYPRARALYMRSSFFLATPMDKDSSVRDRVRYRRCKISSRWHHNRSELQGGIPVQHRILAWVMDPPISLDYIRRTPYYVRLLAT